MADYTTAKDIKPANWIHLQELLFKDSFDPEINRHRSKYVFRGLADSQYELETSLSRLKNKPVEMEKHLIRNFRKYSPINSVSEDKLWHWISLAQHITERIIYPGLDGLCKWLRRWYSKKD